MSRKIDVYVGEPLALAIEGHDHTRSGRINAVCSRYQAIIADSVPTMSRNEWLMICDALNGVWLSDERSVKAVWAEIADAEREAGLGRKWGVDADALAARVRDSSTASKTAIVEVVERFWLLGEGLDHDAALAKAGAVCGQGGQVEGM